MRFADGENVGPYRIIQQLGQGGMATVFKAYHPALDRYVAIKALHPAFMEDPNFLARFQREARVVARLEHENIVPIYDYAEHAGRPYLVMKFIEGETLKANLAKTRLTKQKILDVMIAVGAALGYAHERGVLHRDIKPSNVLITPKGRIYLADFGLARIAEAGQSTLSGDMMLGTPHYISPEQARGEMDLDAGTDIYSLGIVLYELCVGKVPFSSDTPFSIIHDHIYTPLPLPRSINPHVPENIEKVLLKALAKERDDRYQDVAAFISQFKAALMGKGVKIGEEEALIAAATTVPGEPLESAVEVFPKGGEAEAPISSEAVEVPTVQPQQLEADRPPRKWVWILSGAGISLFFLLAFLIGVGNSAEASTVEFVEPPPAVEAELGPMEESNDPDEISEAQSEVDHRPDDPFARLRLAERLYETGYTRAAFLELYKAVELLIEAEEYPNAGKSLLTALEWSGEGIGADVRMNSLLSQILFYGAESPGMEPIFGALLDREVEWDPFPGLYGRYLLYQGREEEADSLVMQILEERPLDLFANAAVIDYHLIHDDVAEAEQELQKILPHAERLPWLEEYFQELLASLGSAP